jgi:hypothetical protein
LGNDKGELADGSGWVVLLDPDDCAVGRDCFGFGWFGRWNGRFRDVDNIGSCFFGSALDSAFFKSVVAAEATLAVGVAIRVGAVITRFGALMHTVIPC